MRIFLLAFRSAPKTWSLFLCCILLCILPACLDGSSLKLEAVSFISNTLESSTVLRIHLILTPAEPE